MLNIYVANLGKYNEGKLVGEWTSLPITEEALDTLYKRIGISEEPDENGCIYEEVAIHDYETDLPIKVGEWDNILELSEAMEVFEDLQGWEMEVVESILEAGEYDDILEAVEHVDDFVLISGVDDEEDLGRRYYEDGLIDIPEYLVDYFDFEAYGRDCSWDGTFTKHGFLYHC